MGVDESVPHFLFDCAQLAELSAELLVAVKSALALYSVALVGTSMTDIMTAFNNLTPERRAAVVLGGTLRDWNGYCLDYATDARVVSGRDDGRRHRRHLSGPPRTSRASSVSTARLQLFSTGTTQPRTPTPTLQRSASTPLPTS